MRVCLIALPLMARSGVYRSTVDLVTAARAAGHDWSALVGVRPGAPGEPVPTPGVTEVSVLEHGRGVLHEIRTLIAAFEPARQADAVITLISQADMAIRGCTDLRGIPHVAWVRGLPWPDRGEQGRARRIALRHLEARALRAADDVWATTPLLARQVATARTPAIVPAGIAPLERTSFGETAHAPLVWAARLTPDKRPGDFAALLHRTGHRGRIHGAGPLEATLRASAPAALEWGGWRPAAELWHDASAFVSTAQREAYGRSAVEAAWSGLPVILSDQVGVAPFLYTDPELAQRFTLPLGADARWDAAVHDLAADPALRRRVSNHVHENAARMSIDASVRSAVDRLQSVLGRSSRSSSEMLDSTL